MWIYAIFSMKVVEKIRVGYEIRLDNLAAVLVGVLPWDCLLTHQSQALSCLYVQVSIDIDLTIATATTSGKCWEWYREGNAGISSHYPCCNTLIDHLSVTCELSSDSGKHLPGYRSLLAQSPHLQHLHTLWATAYSNKWVWAHLQSFFQGLLTITSLQIIPLNDFTMQVQTYFITSTN